MMSFGIKKWVQLRHKAVPTPAFFTQCQDVTRLNEVFEGSPKRSFRNLHAYPAVDLWSRGVRKAFQIFKRV